MSVLPGPNYGDAIVHGIQLSLFAQPPRASIGWILTHREANTLSTVAPFQIVGAFLVPLFLAIHDNNVGLHAPIGREHNATIPPPMRGLDSFGEVDFAVGHR